MKDNNSQSESLKDSTSREKVLKKIRHALLDPSDNPFTDLDFESSVYTAMDEDKDVQFAYELSRLGANFIYCKSPSDMLQKVKALFVENQWKEACCNEELIGGLLHHAGISAYTGSANSAFHHISVTSCECLIARTGSIMVSSALDGGRRLPFTCDIHIVIAFTSQVVEDIRHALDFIKKKYSSKLPSMVSIISGTSRSDDIEKIMIPAGHGPKELYVFMADEESVD
jgi:L-lactate dehydrogenase complex protein LldG